jgi:hypothetical protein
MGVFCVNLVLKYPNSAMVNDSEGNHQAFSWLKMESDSLPGHSQDLRRDLFAIRYTSHPDASPCPERQTRIRTQQTRRNRESIFPGESSLSTVTTAP